jgi:hypothetical protein
MSAWLAAVLTAVHPLALAVLTMVTLQRLAELALSRRNTRRLLAQGGDEVAPGHYPAIVVLHAAWLSGLWLLALPRAPDLTLLAVFSVLPHWARAGPRASSLCPAPAWCSRGHTGC